MVSLVGVKTWDGGDGNRRRFVTFPYSHVSLTPPNSYGNDVNDLKFAIFRRT